MLAVLVLVGLLSAGVTKWVAWNRAAPVRLLQSADPAERQRGVWLTVTEKSEAGALCAATLLPDEPDPGRRAELAYAIGRAGVTGLCDVVAVRALRDPAPRVRYDAWLATARLDPARFRELAAQAGTATDPWDRAGLAHAWAELGDTRGTADLLAVAAEGDPDQQRAASLALRRWVAPLLETVGRWPLSPPDRENEAWPAELVAEVRQRCQTVNLQAIADNSRPHTSRVAALQRNIGKLLGAREKLARLLGAAPAVER